MTLTLTQSDSLGAPSGSHKKRARRIVKQELFTHNLFMSVNHPMSEPLRGGWTPPDLRRAKRSWLLGWSSVLRAVSPPPTYARCSLVLVVNTFAAWHCAGRVWRPWGRRGGDFVGGVAGDGVLGSNVGSSPNSSRIARYLSLGSCLFFPCLFLCFFRVV